MKKEKKEVHKQTVFVSVIILIALSMLGIIIFVFWVVSLRYISTDDASIEGIHASVSSKIMEKIKVLNVDEGDIVKAGQTIAELDDTNIKAQITQSNVALNYARENLELAKINLDKISGDFKRIKKVYNAGVSTEETYDHAKKAFETANVQYSLARVQVDNATAQLGILETQLNNTKITSPISGTIAKKYVTGGEIIQPNIIMFDINDLKHIWVIANFEETKVRFISPGQDVNINIDAYPGYKFKGKVVMIGRAIVPPPFNIGESTKTTQKIPIKIFFNEIHDSMVVLPGMSVEVKIKIK